MGVCPLLHIIEVLTVIICLQFNFKSVLLFEIMLSRIWINGYVLNSIFEMGLEIVLREENYNSVYSKLRFKFIFLVIMLSTYLA